MCSPQRPFLPSTSSILLLPTRAMFRTDKEWWKNQGKEKEKKTPFHPKRPFFPLAGKGEIRLQQDKHPRSFIPQKGKRAPLRSLFAGLTPTMCYFDLFSRSRDRGLKKAVDPHLPLLPTFPYLRYDVP